MASDLEGNIRLKRYLSIRPSKAAFMFMFSGLVPAFPNVGNVARIADVDKPYGVDRKSRLHETRHVPITASRRTLYR